MWTVAELTRGWRFLIVRSRTTIADTKAALAAVRPGEMQHPPRPTQPV
jgi:hypothetical protein